MNFIPFLEPVSAIAKKVIDKIWPPQADPNEKLRAEHELTMAMQQREDALINATKDIIVAEMSQGDNYTKRARPTVVYSGLAFIFVVYVAFPMVAFFSGQAMPTLQLPGEFWWAWGGVVSVWTMGRSMEKRGVGGKLTKMVIG